MSNKPVNEEITTTPNVVGTVKPLGTPSPLRPQFVKKTKKNKK